MNAITQSPQSATSGLKAVGFASQLIGVWALVAYTDEHPGSEDTHPFGPQPQGFLIYTADGFVSAQLMKPGRSVFHSSDWHHGTPEEYQESGSGYIAYCGRYEVDEEKGTVTHIPSVALLPNLIHGRQVRSSDLHGDRLTLRAAGAPIINGIPITSRLDWQRATPNIKDAVAHTLRSSEAPLEVSPRSLLPA
jgi:Lipocalin-like domain